MLKNNPLKNQYVIGIMTNGHQDYLGCFPQGMNLGFLMDSRYAEYQIGNYFDYRNWLDIMNGIKTSNLAE
jgi:hypothetical protein